MEKISDDIPFWKVESIGNDFVLVHLADVDALRADSDEFNFLTNLAVRACPRRFGIGSDGLLAIRRCGDGSLLLRMFNPDGTEDFCGNGIRCGFDHALRQGWVDAADLRMTHFGRSISGSAAALSGGAPRGGPEAQFMIASELPPASYRPEDVPLDREDEIFDSEIVRIDGETYSGSVLTTGSTHTVVTVGSLPADEEFFRVSPQIENHPMFPQRTSVMWAQEAGPDQLRLRIWERGVGETRGCGSGSTAAAIDYFRRKGRGGWVAVVNPGGFINVCADTWEASPIVSGTANERFKGSFPATGLADSASKEA